MSKTTHTHRGTCQACGKVQAVDNTTGLLAKHGYKVQYGEFHFVCDAAARKPAEHELAYTHATIEHCGIQALYHDGQVDLLRSGAVIPSMFKRWNREKVKRTPRSNGNGFFETRGDYDVLPINEATPDELAKRVDEVAHEHECKASGFRAHAQFLRTVVVPRLGQPLYANEELSKPRFYIGFKFTYEGVEYVLTGEAYARFGNDRRVGWKVKRVDGTGRELQWSVKYLNDVVNPKPPKVPGGYDTKAARKADLDKLNRQYEKLKRELCDIFCEVPHSSRSMAQDAAYFALPHDLHNWRKKHGEASVKLFPHAQGLVDAINALVVERERVKAAPGA